MRLATAIIACFALSASAIAYAQTTPEEARGIELFTNGDPSDDVEARRLLEIAAASGRPEAVNMLANMVGNGIGGPADPRRAHDLLHRAAELGSIGANATLADYYGLGLNGFPREPERGLRYAIAAAQATGHPRAVAWAQWRLGRMYLNGVGTPVDLTRAYEWMSRAADGGSVEGMRSRASMLALGQGVAENDEEARRWYQRAAESRESGNAQALLSLGGMLIMGEGGPVDVARGYAYLRLAHEGGDEQAERVIQYLDTRIDASIRAEASAIMTAWRAAHGEPLREEGQGRRLN